MHFLAHGGEHGKSIHSSRIHVMMESLIKGAHRRAFKCGKKRVLQKEAAGGKDCSWWVKKEDRLFQRNCDLRKRGRIVRDHWRDFGLNLSIFIQIVNL